MVGDRMRQARLNAGLTLDEVVERLDHSITKQGLSKYERNKSVPKPDFLARLAEVLGVKAAYFLYEPRVNIVWLAYRKHSRQTKTKQVEIEARALDKVEARVYLQSLFYPDEVPEFPSPQRVSTLQDVEEVAVGLRKRWGLDGLPVESVTQLVEDKGGVVLQWSEDRFDGLSGWADERIPVMVCNGDVPDDRWRYNLAHELGYLMMDCTVAAPKEDESFAHRFAAAFLVPADVAVRELGSRRRHLDLLELGLLKKKYGFSMAAWIRRARDLDIISDPLYKDLNILFRSRGFHRDEPSGFKGREEPARLKQMALRGLAEGLISREWFERVCPNMGTNDLISAEKRQTPRMVLEGLMQLSPDERAEVLAVAARKLRKDYDKGKRPGF